MFTGGQEKLAEAEVSADRCYKNYSIYPGIISYALIVICKTGSWTEARANRFTPLRVQVT